MPTEGGPPRPRPPRLGPFASPAGAGPARPSSGIISASGSASAAAIAFLFRQGVSSANNKVGLVSSDSGSN
eukprot:10020386-Lingulodinium_polyedra.AAC.1